MDFDLGPDFSNGPEGTDRSLLAHCLNLLQTDTTRDYIGWAVEFGTGSGETTRMIAEVLPVISFDSFAGLPEDWRPGYPKGKFSEYEMPTDIVGATIVPGLFSDTVPGYDWPSQIALVHLDADLYSSTKTALDAVMDYVEPGAILVFDEFFGYEGCENHEQRAWFEWCNDLRYVDWTVIGHGREQWAIQIEAI